MSKAKNTKNNNKPSVSEKSEEVRQLTKQVGFVGISAADLAKLLFADFGLELSEEDVFDVMLGEQAPAEFHKWEFSLSRAYHCLHASFELMADMLPGDKDVDDHWAAATEQMHVLMGIKLNSLVASLNVLVSVGLGANEMKRQYEIEQGRR